MLHYVRLNVKAEPLIWKWYAWPYLIPPIQAGCNIVERHLKIMKSFVQFPKIHMQAVKNPDLAGGPFVELDEQNVNLVRDLIAKTEEECNQYIMISEALKSFKKMIQKEAVGNSIEPFYKKLPDCLDGLVELVYDMENHPQVRLLEQLIYHRYYTTDGQSISLSLIDSDTRAFTLSTPRVVLNNELDVHLPFSDPSWDSFFNKRIPVSIPDLLGKLGIQGQDVKFFESFFTQEKPHLADDRNYLGADVRIRYFGHATILLQTDQVSIMVDPVLSYDIPGESRFSYKDLPDKLDYVLLTHNHQDHVMFETLLQIRHMIGTIIVPRNNKGALEDPSLKLILTQIGFNNVVAIDELEPLDIPDGKIMSTPFFGEHSDLNIQTKTAHFLSLKGKKFLLAADSNNISPKMYKYLFDYTDGVDVLFLGMECDGSPLSWLYGPLLCQPLKRSHDEERTLSGSNFERAWALAKESKCTEAYVYAMGMEPWLTYIMAMQYGTDSIQLTESNKFVEACLSHGIKSERLYMQKEWIVS